MDTGRRGFFGKLIGCFALPFLPEAPKRPSKVVVDFSTQPMRWHVWQVDIYAPGTTNLTFTPVPGRWVSIDGVIESWDSKSA